MNSCVSWADRRGRRATLAVMMMMNGGVYVSRDGVVGDDVGVVNGNTGGDAGSDVCDVVGDVVGITGGESDYDDGDADVRSRAVVTRAMVITMV